MGHSKVESLIALSRFYYNYYFIYIVGSSVLIIVLLFVYYSNQCIHYAAIIKTVMLTDLHINYFVYKWIQYIFFFNTICYA